MFPLYMFLHIIMFILQYQTGSSLLNNTTKNPLCRKEQRQLLLQLEQQLSLAVFPNSSRECCRWDGVTCDRSGRVIGLDLSDRGLSTNIHSNCSLFRLTHLRKLSLADNDLGGASQISSAFGRLSRLTHLNLSDSGFVGPIPQEFYHLSNLVSLDLSSDLDLTCDIKMLLRNMTKIRVVLLAYVNITSELPMNTSSFLTHLDLSETGLHGGLPPTIFEKPGLKILNLGQNDGLTGSLPIFNKSNVLSFKELDLSETSISGRLPDSIGFMKSLKHLRLSWCKLSGPIPESIGNLTEIARIELSWNAFSGEVPTGVSNLRWLTHFDLSSNRLHGQLPKAFSNLGNLINLSLYLCNLVYWVKASSQAHSWHMP